MRCGTIHFLPWEICLGGCGCSSSTLWELGRAFSFLCSILSCLGDQHGLCCEAARELIGFCLRLLGTQSRFLGISLSSQVQTEENVPNGVVMVHPSIHPSNRSSAQFSRSVVSSYLRPHEIHHARPPCPSPTPWVYPNSCPLSRWCHPTMLSCVIPFSSCLQSFPASGSFHMSQFFTSGGQSIGVSASTSVLPTNTQDCSTLRWTGWISLQSKGLSIVFSNTTVQKHQFFCAQLSL